MSNESEDCATDLAASCITSLFKLLKKVKKVNRNAMNSWAHKDRWKTPTELTQKVIESHENDITARVIIKYRFFFFDVLRVASFAIKFDLNTLSAPSGDFAAFRYQMCISRRVPESEKYLREYFIV